MKPLVEAELAELQAQARKEARATAVARLVCEHNYAGQYCERYRVEYERACDCVRRALPEGGAP